jgi:hypothetical protein
MINSIAKLIVLIHDFSMTLAKRVATMPIAISTSTLVPTAASKVVF